MSRIRIIGVVSALVFWLLGVQGSALDLGCGSGCTEIDLDSGAVLMVDFENGGWPSAREDLACKETGDNVFAAGPCTTRFEMGPADIQNGSIPRLSRWWIIVAMVSLAFVGFFHLHRESMKSFDNVFPDDVDEQTRDMAKALADVVRDHSPGR